MKTLIIGSGANVAKELRKVKRRSFDVTIGVNQAARDHRCDWQSTLHPLHYLPPSAPMVSYVALKEVAVVMPWQWVGGKNSGSSGLYAVKFALEYLKADHVTLAGIGMNVEPHYYGGGDWQAALRFRETWELVAPQLRGRVESLGGWTAELLRRDAAQMGETPEGAANAETQS